MGLKLHIFGLIIAVQLVVRIAGVTDANDFGALSSLKTNWQNTPPSWTGTDPCGSGWEGIGCTGSRITSIVLTGMALTGTLTGDIGQLTELQTLDLSQNTGLKGTLPSSAIGNLKKLQNLFLVGCSFSGPIPDTIGSLTQLVSLALASNSFDGPLPPSLGNLINLFMLDVTENKLTGTIPVSDGTSPGLDMLVNTKHFHFGRNQLSGPIPPKLFNSSMTLIHVLFDSNQLNGSIPSSIELVQTLEVMRLDRNLLSGEIPADFTKLARVTELYLSNNQLTGSIPNLTGMNVLTYLDMSNNSFKAATFPQSLFGLKSLTSLLLESTQLQGEVPPSIFSLPSLESIVLSHNNLSGTLDIGSSFSSQLELIDLQNNSIGRLVTGTGYDKTLLMQGNPLCQNTGSVVNYCTPAQAFNSSYATPADNCVEPVCPSTQTSSPTCKCSFPIIGTLHIRSYSFSDLDNVTYYIDLHDAIMKAFQDNRLPVDSLSLSFPITDVNDYLDLKLEVFPSGSTKFNRTGFSIITSQLNNLTFVKRPPFFGPFYFTLSNADYFAGQKKSSNTAIVIGAAVGGSVLVVLLILAALYALRQRKRADKAAQQSDPFASWGQGKENGTRPEIKGVRSFTFEEIRKCTNSFSNANILGAGGYGKVYKGTLLNGMVVAIKRAQQGSMQGSHEFKTEIELLSRVHHRNLVSLVGFCYEQGEQMLIYEYISNGTLKDTISGKTSIKLDWNRRLRMALDSARGLVYLHELADPPIIHRDVKSNNILLDDHLVAKVADFGLSKLLGEGEGHVTTQVKGTMGYMDPEYFMTEQLTEKSDVYSFGVVMLELITGRNPIEHGKHIVSEVRVTIDKTQDLYNLQNILDPSIRSSTNLPGFEKFVDLALRCVEEMRDNRPTMGELVKEIESILQLASLEGKGGNMVSTTSSYTSTTQGSFRQRNTNNAFFEYSGSFLGTGLELQQSNSMAINK